MSILHYACNVKAAYGDERSSAAGKPYLMSIFVLLMNVFYLMIAIMALPCGCVFKTTLYIL